MKKSAVALAALALTGAFALAQTTAQTAPKPGFVRVVHASPDSGAMDVYLDDRRTVAGAAFKAVTPYGDVPAGAHALLVTAAGNKASVIISTDLTVESGRYYTVVATGRQGSVLPAVYTSYALNSSKTMAAVNVYYLAPGGQRLDLLSADTGNAKLMTGLRYHSKLRGLIKPTTLNINAVPSGKATPVVASLKGLVLGAGKSYSVFALGAGGKKPVPISLVAVEDTVKMGSMAGQ